MPGDVQPRLIPCYAVSDEHLRDALAGRLLARLAAGETDSNHGDWFYGDGFAAGARWARELATCQSLEQLDVANQQLCQAVPRWLKGFVDGALGAWRKAACARPVA